MKKAGGDTTFEDALDQEVTSKLDDLMLLEFPVFALNEDYMRALAIIIEHKLEQIRSIINSQVQIKTQRSIPTMQEQPEELKSIETNGPHVPLRVRYQHHEQVQPQITESQLQVNQWVQKKQTWKAKLAAFQRLASAIQTNLINSTFIEGYVGIVSFADTLMRKERAVALKMGREVKAKVYYRWFDAYFS